MAFTFPIPRADFFDQICLAEGFRMSPASNTVGARTRGGAMLTASYGAQLWEGSFAINPTSANRRSDIRALIEVLRGAGSSFEMGHPFYTYPQSDPDGTALNGAAITVRVTPTEGNDLGLIRIEGLPDGYVMRPEDHISVSWGGRKSYHMVVQGDTSLSANGRMTLGVRPLMPIGIPVGSEVQLIRPTLKAKLRPSSFTDGAYQGGRLAMGHSLEWVQDLS